MGFAKHWDFLSKDIASGQYLCVIILRITVKIKYYNIVHHFLCAKILQFFSLRAQPFSTLMSRDPQHKIFKNGLFLFCFSGDNTTVEYSLLAGPNPPLNFSTLLAFNSCRDGVIQPLREKKITNF
jgi:hypothetical protein